MEFEFEIESTHGEEPYVAPDVVRLGTAEALTAGAVGALQTDISSNIG